MNGTTAEATKVGVNPRNRDGTASEASTMKFCVHFPSGSEEYGMIDATIKMTVPAEKRKEVLQTVKAILGPIRKEPGCISCNCYIDVEDEDLFCFREEWETSEDLENHLRSERFGVLVGAMSLLQVEPDIRFNTISSVSGTEALKALRT